MSKPSAPGLKKRRSLQPSPAPFSTVQAWCFVVAGTFSAALVDLLTGTEPWLGPVYLLVICFTTWALGWREALATTVVCAALMMAIDGWMLHPFESSAHAWALVMRVTAVFSIIMFLENLRRAHAREWLSARTDALTGVLNRKAFFEHAAFLSSAKHWCILAYADLDGLKQINDRSGHEAGDEALKAYATAVGGMIRAHDVFARVGGDEFLLLMQVNSQADAHGLAPQLHNRMNSVSLANGSLIRCSLGVLVLSPGVAKMSERHVRAADRLMYEAKEVGASLRIMDEKQAFPTFDDQAKAEPHGDTHSLPQTPLAVLKAARA